MENKQKLSADAGCTTKIKLVIGLLALTCVGLFVAVIVLSVNSESDQSNKDLVPCASLIPSSNGATYTNSNNLFRDLSEDEIIRVQDYILNKASLNVTEHFKASVASNYIFLIELWNPDKDEALAYLDGNGKEPTRLARVIIFGGALAPPIVQEILVPVDAPKNHVVFSSGRKNPIPFLSRPMDSLEMNEIQNLVDRFTHVASEVMWESFEMNCSTSCVSWTPSVPFQAGERTIWLCLNRPVFGSTTYPLPIEILIQQNGSYTSKWKIEKVFYNKVVFDSIESFMNAYKSGNIKLFQAAPIEESLYSSFARRGSIKPASRNVESSQYEPGGKRYTAEKNQVEYMGWSFDFRVRTSSGPQLFDIRFNNTRIIYELSLQEAASFYTGFSPVPSYSDYLDSTWALGKTFELVKGVDCPDTASYFDVIAFVDSGKVSKRKNAVCVFELNMGIPLRRHYAFSGDSFSFYGGIPSTALVFRTITTPYNYDYIFDYIFYQNGVIEVKVTTTGYILSSYWTSEARQFSNRVQKDVSGSNHDHFFHFKVDFDIAGKENSFEVIKTKINKTKRWAPNGGAYRYQKYYEHDHRKTEKAAAYTYDFDTPSYLNFYNEAAKNIHGVPRGYRVQLNSIMKQMYPRNWTYTRAIQWTYNQLVVTKYKKNETRSSSIYNQMNFFDPVIDFSQFIDDNEDISNEDLISWVMVGVMHLPHSEDIPTTTTPGNSAGFYLRPYNYFDEDPSVASRDSVVITPSGKDGSNVKRSERNARLSCVPRDDPIDYSGILIEL